MKKVVNNIIVSLLGATIAIGIGVSIAKNSKADEVDASNYSVNTVPTTIDCNDTTDANIRSYYSSLNSLATNQRQGTNLLKNLKPILKNNQKYFSYGSKATTAVWQAYEIVNRDWSKSPASAISGYNSSTKIITGYTYGTSDSNPGTDPYVHALYVNRNVTNQTKAWGNHNQDQWGINQEHVWPKSCGFDDTSKGAGARGDLMHLWAGNGSANNTHSNNYYGYVDRSKSYTDCGNKYSNLSGNLSGKSSTLGGSYTVFEPQDSDKGDIARAIFYMAARYNYLSGSDSDGIDAGNPNLEIINELNWGPKSSSYTSTTSVKGQMGILQDLLEWNRLDKPDAWEIHRNNLLFNNFTNNRNPFIDFPEWAEYIWGKSVNGSYSSTSTGYATPNSDNINTFSDGGGGGETSNVVFTMGEDGAASHFDGNGADTYSETVSGTTLSISNGVKMYTGARDATGKSCLKFGTSSAGGSFTLNLSGISDLTQVIFRVANYKSNTGATISIDSGEATTLTKQSNNGQYDEVAVNITSQTSLSVAFVGRAMLNEIKFVFASSSEKALDSITLDTSDAPTTFNVGDEFSYEGLAVTANYDDGTSDIVTPTSVSTPNMSTTGNKTVTVTYTENGISKTADYSITVNSNPTLTWTAPTIKVYSGTSLTGTDVNGWAITYNDGVGHETVLTYSQVTVKLSGSSISIPYSWSASDDGKTLCVSYSSLTTATTTVDITQTINPVNMTVPESSAKSDLTFTAKCNGSGTADDSKTWTITSDATSESIFDSTNGRGIHYGTNGDSVSYIALTSSSFTAGKITKVEVNASTASGVTATVGVAVGGVQFGGEPQSITSSAVPDNPYTFTGEVNADTIVVTIAKPSSATKALYCKSVVVTYTVPSSTTQIANVAGHEDAQKAVVKFAKAFNDALGATNNCTTNLDSAWSTATSAWNTFLSDAAALGSTEEAYAKNLIKYATAQWTSGTDSDYEYCLERVMATYEKCVNVHGKTAFMSDVRSVDRIPNVNPIKVVTENSGATTIVLVISLLSVATLGGYLVAKKRKQY